MKKFLFLVMCALALVCVPAAAQDIGNPTEAVGMGFGTFSALIALVSFFIPFVVEIFKSFLPNAPSFAKQIISWLIGIILGFFGWKLQIGFLSDMSWWLALIYGLGAGLIANGVFDTGLVTTILGMFGIRKN